MAANKKTRKEKVIEVLNKARSMELFAIHQGGALKHGTV